LPALLPANGTRVAFALQALSTGSRLNGGHFSSKLYINNQYLLIYVKDFILLKYPRPKSRKSTRQVQYFYADILKMNTLPLPVINYSRFTAAPKW
jgi:hypothetical protein